MLGLVVQNLVTNALRFNRSDAPVVEIDAERAATAWRITVSDNGIGIAPDATERVFALFSRLHRHEDYPGTGLGLAITKRIVERHGGSVRIAPRPQGGTVVTVELPAPAEAPAA
jgi:signal transduction histidine kinase